MCIDTNVPKHWNPLRVLSLLGLWLAALVTLAFMASGCGGTIPPSMNGSIMLTWSITDLDHRTATCTQVSARSVALQLRNRASGAIVLATFPCEASPGSAQVPPGVYDITFALHASDGATLATAPTQTSVAVVANQTKRLAPVTFMASTEGGVVLTVAAPPSSSNCKSETAGGAGITGSTIAFERIDPGHEGCAAVTFIRRVGTQQVGTYVADNCSFPSVGACIERAETLSARAPAGTYRIHLVGKVATRDCWKADGNLTIVVGKPLTTTLDLTRQPGC